MMQLSSYTMTIPAATVTPQRIGGTLDAAYQPFQQRRVVAQLGAAGDTLLFEATMDNTTWFPVVPSITGDVLPHAVLIEGPVVGIRATKTGTAGAATINAIV
jgi:hypothetical protein